MNTITVKAIIIRTWFQRTMGNTYHTVEFILDNGTTRKSPVAYGGGTIWKRTAKALLDQEPGLVVTAFAMAGHTVFEKKRRKDL